MEAFSRINLTLDPDWTPTQKAGVRLMACAMSMDLLGIKGEELIEGVEVGGVATYLDHAQSGNVNLFGDSTRYSLFLGLPLG